MYLVEGITSEPHQLHTLLFEGEQIDLTIRYLDAVQIWEMDVSYMGRSAATLSMVSGVPMLSGQLMPFDFTVTVSHSVDPFSIDDFASGRCELWFIAPDELAT